MIYYKEYDFAAVREIKILKDSKHKCKRRAGESANNRRDPYFDAICAFDIETTNVIINDPERPEAIMYLWQFAINDTAVYGRTWDEYKEFRSKLISNLRSSKAKLCVWVHNLAFEFQFLRTLFNFEEDQVFLLDRRAPLKACDGRLLYRCSYKQTNMSLANFTERMGAKHGKLSGEEFDYSKIRYPWTPLSERELAYAENDVLGLVESIRIEMEKDGDTLYSIPDTSTGYVRRDVKTATNYCREAIKKLAPDPDLYSLLKWAFRGGNTHANPAYTGKVLKNVNSYDMSSSYPAVQCNCDFPTAPFFKCYNLKAEYIMDLIFVRKKPVVLQVVFIGLQSREYFPTCPYLSLSKCNVTGEKRIDNGRVVSAAACETACTDVDFRIIARQYRWDDMIIEQAYKSSYGKLPSGMIAQVQKYFETKTALKGVAGREYYYQKDKNKLNSIYGMTAQDPGKDDCKYINGEYVMQPGELEKRLSKATVPYQWGVWTTAHARARLQVAIDSVGSDFVYTDTDSVKFVGDHAAEIDAINVERYKESENSGSIAADPHGEVHYMGVYEKDDHYEYFITNGAKKYAYVKNGKLGVTCAGVSTRPAKDSTKYISIAAEELQKIEAFKPGFVFSLAGKSVVYYNDHAPYKHIVDGKEILVTSNTAIIDGTYTLGFSKEYRDYLTTLEEFR